IVWQGSLQELRPIPRNCQPPLDFLPGSEDYWHRLGMYRPDFGIGLGSQERIDVDRHHSFLDLPDTGPVRPDAREEGEFETAVRLEPDIALVTVGLDAGLGERSEGDEAAVLHAKPALPMLTSRVADVCRTAIRFHLQKLVEVVGLSFGIK